jgi:hypothetical protein
MGYCVTHMIGVDTPEYANGKPCDWAERVKKVIRSLENADYPVPIDEEDLSNCLVDRALWGNKSCVMVIAGAWNYWSHDGASEFCRALSKEFCSTVYLSTFTEDNGMGVSIFNNGIRCPKEEIHAVISDYKSEAAQ